MKKGERGGKRKGGRERRGRQGRGRDAYALELQLLDPPVTGNVMAPTSYLVLGNLALNPLQMTVPWDGTFPRSTFGRLSLSNLVYV